MEDARSRRARLEALRRVSEGGEGGERSFEGRAWASSGDKEASEAGPKRPTEKDVGKEEDARGISFRNYIPKDEQLVGDRKRQADVRDPDVVGWPSVDATEDVLRLGGEKANWDIKRDIARKRDALERKTREAMNELVRKEEARRLVELGQAD